MAIKEFKEIIEKKGYKLDSKDRKIFERELFASIFGASGTDWNITGNTDVIEFVMYDADDNILPQGETGKLVRYIYLDDENINKYFHINENSDVKKTNGAKEFIIDTDILIKDAGYSNGIFKTQVSLLNRRVGSEGENLDKLWIHEISPSRTEIRVVPLRTKDSIVIPDLENRYKVFTNNGEFRDDTNTFVQKYVENVNIQQVLENFLKVKGTIVQGQSYIDLIKREFKVQNFQSFLLDIKTKFVQATQYFIENRIYDINNINYGNSLETPANLELSIEEIVETASDILGKVIEFYLPKRNVLEKSTLSMEEQITFDKLSQILKTTTSDSIYSSTIPDNILAQVPIPDNPDKEGFESNYNTTKIWYVHSTSGRINYTDSAGRRKWVGSMYDSVELTYRTAEPLDFAGTDMRDYPKIKNIKLPIVCKDPRAINYGQAGICIYKPIPIKGDDIIVYPEPFYDSTDLIDDFTLPIKSIPISSPLVDVVGPIKPIRINPISIRSSGSTRTISSDFDISREKPTINRITEREQ